MAVILITGGAGFIGSNLVRYALAHTDYRLVVVDKLTYAGSLVNLDGVLNDARVTFVEADITDAAAMRRTFGEHKPAAVVNLAAETHVDRSIDDPRSFVDTNIVGTFVLLECARGLRASLSSAEGAAFRFLHVSTDEVYGTLGVNGSFTEETPYAPNSPYAASKAAADHLIRSYFHTYRLPVLVTNCSNNYGPYQFPEKLIPLMILNGAEGRLLPIYGDGQNVRDWLHVEDHCTALMLVLSKGRPGERYNIGGGNERTTQEVVDQICDALEELWPAVANRALEGRGSYRSLRSFVTDRPGHDRRYAIDSTKIARELGWQSRRSFELGVLETVRWYLEHAEWCQQIQTGPYDRQRLGFIR